MLDDLWRKTMSLERNWRHTPTVAAPTRSGHRLNVSMPPFTYARRGFHRHRGNRRRVDRASVRRPVVGTTLAALKHVYREGLADKRAGVMLLDLVEAGQAQVSLFDTNDPRDDRLIEAVDAINDRLGRERSNSARRRRRPLGDPAAPSARLATPPVGKTSRRSRPEPRQIRARDDKQSNYTTGAQPP